MTRAPSWRQSCFLESDGCPVLHHCLVAALLDAIPLPSSIAICKCAAHTNAKELVSQGNTRTDAVPQTTAILPYSSSLLFTTLTPPSQTLLLCLLLLRVMLGDMLVPLYFLVSLLARKTNRAIPTTSSLSTLS